jgi:hypothetical protein
MDEPIEESYFKWLCAKVVRPAVPTPSLTYWKLLSLLHHTEFVWTLSGDDNRAEDGRDLRHSFNIEAGLEDDDQWEHVPCSVLEMIIALIDRAEFMTGISAKDWFWYIMENLGLDDCNDASGFSERAVSDVLERLVWRNYRYDGVGGMFPMQHPNENQTQIEIWHQFSEYLIEHNL